MRTEMSLLIIRCASGNRIAIAADTVRYYDSFGTYDVNSEYSLAVWMGSFANDTSLRGTTVIVVVPHPSHLDVGMSAFAPPHLVQHVAQAVHGREPRHDVALVLQASRHGQRHRVVQPTRPRQVERVVDQLRPVDHVHGRRRFVQLPDQRQPVLFRIVDPAKDCARRCVNADRSYGPDNGCAGVPHGRRGPIGRFAPVDCTLNMYHPTSSATGTSAVPFSADGSSQTNGADWVSKSASASVV